MIEIEKIIINEIELFLNQTMDDNITNDDDAFEVRYEKWLFGGESQGDYAWNLYWNNNPVASISNGNNPDKNNVRIVDIFSRQKGMGSKLIMMLLDEGVVIETGIPERHSISTKAYYLVRKIIDIINNNSQKYKYTVLGKANNDGLDDNEHYKDIKDKQDNFHYRFEAI